MLSTHPLEKERKRGTVSSLVSLRFDKQQSLDGKSGCLIPASIWKLKDDKLDTWVAPGFILHGTSLHTLPHWERTFYTGCVFFFEITSMTGQGGGGSSGGYSTQQELSHSGVQSKHSSSPGEGWTGKDTGWCHAPSLLPPTHHTAEAF